MNDLTLAEIAYRAYGKRTAWKNYQGQPMPDWFELPATIQSAWRAAAWAVVAEWVARDNENTPAEREK